MTEHADSQPRAAVPPADERIRVSDVQVQAAMAHYEKIYGKGDGVAICREVAKLADLLGAMWYEHEADAEVRAGSKIGQLLIESGVLPSASA
jgi:hypothetical protein